MNSKKYLISIFSFFITVVGFSQRMVSGIVLGKTGKPLSNAIIGAGNEIAFSNEAGKFEIKIFDNINIITVTYEPCSKNILIQDKRTNLIIDLPCINDDDDNEVLPNIGTMGNIKMTKLNNSVPVDIIYMNELVDKNGYTDINQILNYTLSSFFSARHSISDGTDFIDPISLRGLGSDQVLILLNGKRKVAQALINVNGTVNRGMGGTDITAIPLSAIDKIEVLRDGASALYGSDAIAGVINIILKGKLSDNFSIKLSSGTNLTTNFNKNYAFNKMSDLPQYIDKNTNILSDGLNYGVNLEKKIVFNKNDDCYLFISGEYNYRGATNRGGTYTDLIYPNIGNKNKDDSILAFRQISRNEFDMRIGDAKIIKKSGAYNFNLPFSKGSFYSFGFLSYKDGNSAGFYRYPSSINTALKSRDTNILLKYPNGFLPEINTKINEYTFVGGIKSKVFDKVDFDLSYNIGANSINFGVANSVNYSQTFDSKDFQTNFDCGKLSFKQEIINIIINKKITDSTGIAFGGEWRKERFNIFAGENASWKNFNPNGGTEFGAQVFPGFTPTNAVNSSRTNLSAFAEISYKLTKRWNYTSTFRIEKYQNIKPIRSTRIATNYKIFKNTSLRASYNTGFRVPSLQQRDFSKTTTVFVTQNGNTVPQQQGTYRNDSDVAKALGIDELKPERSEHYGFGIVGVIGKNKNFTYSIDYYHIEIKDRIVLTNNFSVINADIKKLLEPVGANAANVFTNSVNTVYQGLEEVLTYKINLPRKRVVQIDGALTLMYNKVSDSTSILERSASRKPYINVSNQIFSAKATEDYFNREDQSRLENVIPVNKTTLFIVYKSARFSSNLRFTRFGEVYYKAPNFDPDNADKFPVNKFTNEKETLDQKFSPKIVTDIALNFAFSKNLLLTFGSNNLFDVYSDEQTHSSNVSNGRFIYSRRVFQMGNNGRFVFLKLKYNIM